MRMFLVLTIALWDWKSTYNYDSLPDGRLFIIPLMLHSHIPESARL